jgi:hypothetical protein
VHARALHAIEHVYFPRPLPPGFIPPSFPKPSHALAPTCDNCGIHIGHGLEKEGTFFCCDHCAEAKGVTGLRDRIGAGGVIEMGSRV